jgi:hypothetical protein
VINHMLLILLVCSLGATSRVVASHSNSDVTISQSQRVDSLSSTQRSADSTTRMYSASILPFDLVQSRLQSFDLCVDTRIGTWSTIGAALHHSSVPVNNGDRFRVLAYSDLYFSGDAYSTSFVVSPFVILRNAFTRYSNSSQVSSGIGALVGYKDFYGKPGRNAFSISCMAGVGSLWEIHGTGYSSLPAHAINLYAQIGIGYVMESNVR